MEPSQAHLNIENFAQLSHPAWQLVAVLLMVGYGAHLAFAPLFLASSTQVAPRYRLGAWLGAVVMIAAGLSLYREYAAWQDAFVFAGDRWVPAVDTVFSNAFRYANWTITIPLLIAQLLLALNLPKSRMHRWFGILVIAAVAMIWLGLVGQFYEHSSVAMMLVWGFLSTLPFVVLVWGVWRVLQEGRQHTPVALHPWLKNIFFYFLFFWGLYPIAYMLPAIGDGEVVIVLRQLLLTVADIFSKLVYGVILLRFTLRRSAFEGHRTSIEALSDLDGALAPFSNDFEKRTPA